MTFKLKVPQDSPQKKSSIYGSDKKKKIFFFYFKEFIVYLKQQGFSGKPEDWALND